MPLSHDLDPQPNVVDKAPHTEKMYTLVVLFIPVSSGIWPELYPWRPGLWWASVHWPCSSSLWFLLAHSTPLESTELIVCFLSPVIERAIFLYNFPDFVGRGTVSVSVSLGYSGLCKTIHSISWHSVRIPPATQRNTESWPHMDFAPKELTNFKDFVEHVKVQVTCDQVHLLTLPG